MKGAELELPAGFRFHPTDDELVNHYLLKKCGGQPISVPIIAEIDLYKYDPWQLPEMAAYGEKEWYFFSPRDRKYPNGTRPNRAAGTGYWKATGADKPIGRPKTLGIKKALVFYAGKAPKGIKTNWIMHEYRLANVDRSAGKRTNLRLDEWVLCRIYNKKGTSEKYYTDTTESDKKYSETMEDEQEQKPNISNMYGNGNVCNMGSSDSPRLNNNTESSCSDHSEIVSESHWNHELQSQNAFDLGFNFDDPFASQIQFQMDQLSPLQDMFMYLPEPF